MRRRASSHFTRGKDAHGIRPESARVGCAARSRQGSAEWVSEQSASSHILYGGKTHTAQIRPELGARGMRGLKPAGFSGVGERAARSLDRVSLQVWSRLYIGVLADTREQNTARAQHAHILQC